MTSRNIFLLLLLLLTVAMITACQREVVYCPVTHLFTQGTTLNAYLRLKDDGSPDCLELREEPKERGDKPKVLFRAFGTITVKMKLEMEGTRFSLFSDTASSQADTSFVLDVLKTIPYFECTLGRKL